jgi:hypothetical protein
LAVAAEGSAAEGSAAEGSAAVLAAAVLGACSAAAAPRSSAVLAALARSLLQPPIVSSESRVSHETIALRLGLGRDTGLLRAAGRRRLERP